MTEPFLPLENQRDYEQRTGKTLRTYREAPALAAKVAEGALPPVQARVPRNPLIVQPWEEVGAYGGELRYTEIYPRFCHYMRHLNEAELLEVGPSSRFHHYSRIDGPVRPGILEAWKSSEDGIVHTFRLREGLKWSDGMPVTTEDVRYTFEDVLMNEDIQPFLTNSEGSLIFLPEWEWIAWGGSATKLEVLDEYGFRFRFGKPYPGFISQQIRSARWHMLLRPKHYVRRFHKKHASPAALETLMKAKGFAPEDWGRFYFTMDPPQREAGYLTAAHLPNIEHYPTLDPWVYKPGYSSEEAVLERNPYYYKIDPEGRQLPYIDRVKRTVCAGLDDMRVRIAEGRTDVQTNFLQLKDYPHYMDRREEGGYEVMLLKPWQGQMLVVTINFCPEDEALRALLALRPFRQALSLAIPRERIRDDIFLGRGRAAQATTSPDNEYYEEWFERSFAAYDPEEANRLLDGIGLRERDEEGYRMMPGGRRLELLMAYFHVTPPADDGASAIADAWRALGLRVPVRRMPSGHEWGKLQVQNKIIFAIWESVGGDPLIPYHEGGLSDPTPLWWLWYETEGAAGGEPIPEAKALYAIREQLKAARDPQERRRLAKEVYRLQAENLWILGTVAGAPQPFVYSARLGNVASAEAKGYFPSTVLGAAEQWFFKPNT